MRRLMLLTPHLLLAAGCAWGACSGSSPSWMAASCSATDIQACIDGMSVRAGDTINVPAGRCNLGTSITLSKNVHLKGNGIDATTLSGGTISVTAIASGENFPTVSGFTLDTTGRGVPGAIHIRANTKKFRVTGNKFVMVPPARTITVGLANYRWKPFGVIDSNVFSCTTVATGVQIYGDNVFASYRFGSADAVYVEDNTFTCGTSADGTGWVDVDYDGSMVFRFNTLTNGGQIAMHGTGNENPRERDGIVGWEIYGNTWTLNTGTHYWLTQLRGGTGMAFNNSTTITPPLAVSGAPYRTVEYRTEVAAGCSNATWSCDGNHPYDGNNVWLSGTSTSGGSPTVMHTTGLTVGAWVGYRLYQGDNSCRISANTATTVTCAAAMEGDVDWSVPTAFAIKSGWPCYMQVGAMKGTTYGSTSGRQQDSVPAYLWANMCSGTFGGGCISGKAVTQGVGIASTCRVTAPDILRNRDFFDSYTNGEQTSPIAPFDGSFTLGSGAGVGYGTRANRPHFCMTGAGYWATDEGSWNKRPGGSQGVLYKCTATNTWTPYYTPYSYPHPARGSAATR